MKRLKFRVWDNEVNAWFTPTYEAHKGRLMGLLVGLDGSLFTHNLRGLAHESTFPDRYVLEQSTGLVDKNGREIYEGDVCRVVHDARYDVKDVAVEWVADEACRSFGVGSTREVSWSHEVIGNVHENPDRARKDPS